MAKVKIIVSVLPGTPHLVERVSGDVNRTDLQPGHTLTQQELDRIGVNRNYEVVLVRRKQ